MSLIPQELQEEYPFSPNFHETEWGRQHYVDAGSGQPVIMVHGNPTWSFYYRNVIKALRENHRCIVPDHLGCGLSDKPHDFPYRLGSHIENLVNLVNDLKLESFDLIVHDWGGAIGMGLATRMPERVRKIIILNTAAFYVPRLPRRISLCRAPLLGKVIVQGFNGFAGPATWMSVKKRLPKHIKEGYLLPYDNWENRIATHRFVMDIPMDATHPTRPVLASIDRNLKLLDNKPVQINWGKHDFVFNDQFLEEWKKRFPAAHVNYYEEAGHYVLEDAAPLINQRIKSFLGTYDAS